MFTDLFFISACTVVGMIVLCLLGVVSGVLLARSKERRYMKVFNERSKEDDK